MAHYCKYPNGKEDTFVFLSHSNQHVCKGKKVNHQLRLVPETVTNTNELKVGNITSLVHINHVLGCFKSVVRFYEPILNCNISVKTYSILSK